MSIQVYDSLTRTKQPFTPVTPGAVRMYVCGPTVYSDCHIGHTMGPVLFDAVARWFKARDYDVTFVNNITDIEDKIINRANETGEPWQDITNRYAQQYFDLLDDLAVTTVDSHPRCTEFIPEMIAFIDDLISKDRAYVAEDGVYFDVQAQPKYGKLAGRTLEPSDATDNGLRHPHDFALWKLAKPNEPAWASPWGDGRPGWHIECSVMSSSLLGGEFDIHGGGEELKFPHHENEIAQSEAHGDAYARCWMHNGLCQYEGAKISKSDPRMRDPAFAQQFQARYLIETYGGEALRFHILRGHYRRPQEFKPSGLEATRTTLERMRKQLCDGLGGEAQPLASLAEIMAVSVPTSVAAMRERFCASMDDDFNTGAALGQLAGILSAARKSDDDAERRAILQVAHGLAGVLGLLARGLDPAPDAVVADSAAVAAVASALAAALGNTPPAWLGADLGDGQAVAARLQAEPLDSWCPAPELSALTSPVGERDAGARFLDDVLRLRQLARAQRDFALGDALRDAFTAAGLAVQDGKGGSTWS